MRKLFTLLTLSLITLTTNAQSCPDDNHPHMIDLGLPSGTKWACCNVGATNPNGYGGYYAWGEIEEKDKYDRSTYSFCYFDDEIVDYCWIDIGDSICGTHYDVAYVQWGGEWQMPSYNQIKELTRNCNMKWKSLNGTNGLEFVGPNGGSIFMPAAGELIYSDLYNCGSEGNYMSGTQYYGLDFSCFLWFDKYSVEPNANFQDNDLFLSEIGRVRGYTVRPVTKPIYGDQNGDADGDGTVSVYDVVVIVNYIMGKQNVNFIFENADIDHDANITITDVMKVVEIILGTEQNVPSLKLATNTLNLNCGERRVITIISGSGNYTVTSSDPTVVKATIENNTVKVTAINQGQATITVTDTQSEQTATIEVYVVNDEVL